MFKSAHERSMRRFRTGRSMPSSDEVDVAVIGGGLSGFATASELLSWADGRTVEPVEPQVIFDGEVGRIVLPGEPGYRD